MLPVSDIPAQSVEAVFSDLDDTMTSQGLMPQEAYHSLFELRAHNIPFVIVSGRPAGWADCLMRLWPIDAMIFENGAGIVVREEGRLKTLTLAQTSLNQTRARLEALFLDLKKEVPSLKTASDQAFRLCDWTIDFAEEPPFLSQTEVKLLMERLQAFNDVTAKLSSIHINYWVGTHTKRSACEYLLEHQLLGKKINSGQVMFLGDSPNDEPLFEYFDLSVGVANVRNFASQFTHPPRYVTHLESGAGFTEAVGHLLSSKKHQGVHS